MHWMKGFWKWLQPGLHIKRWIILGFVGLLTFLVGMGVILQAHGAQTRPLAVRVADWMIAQTYLSLRPGSLGVLLVVVGAALCLFALGKLIYSLTSALDPERTRGGLVDVIYERRKLAHGPRIVVIGGGTGLSTLLRGLKRYSNNITAIVTVTDDGGSSGKLQKQLNILPPGDIRNCLVALADAEAQMTELFQYRFRNSARPESLEYAVVGREARGGVATLPRAENAAATGYGEGLRDHAFGNLLIAAMCAINDGDFEKAIRETSRVLNVRGRVLPSTVSHVRLRAEMEDGSLIDGETNIAGSALRIKRIELVPNDACPVDDVFEALARADIIVLGPGSVYTSVIPNLLVRGIPEAIRQSKAKKVYVCNVMTQPGETDGFTASDHVRAIEAHARCRVFEYVVVNTEKPSQELVEKYRRSGAVLVEADTDRIKAEGYRPIVGNFINQTDVVHHESARVAEAILDLVDTRAKTLRGGWALK